MTVQEKIDELNTPIQEFEFKNDIGLLMWKLSEDIEILRDYLVEKTKVNTELEMISEEKRNYWLPLIKQYVNECIRIFKSNEIAFNLNITAQQEV